MLAMYTYPNFLCFKDYAMKGIIVDIANWGGSGNIRVNFNGQEVQIEYLEQPQRFVLPEETKTVTIEARSWSKGMLASFSNGIVTDESCSCLRDLPSTHPCCHNRKNASEVTETRVSTPQEIALNAKWIWIWIRNCCVTSLPCKQTFGKFKYCIQNVL